MTVKRKNHKFLLRGILFSIYSKTKYSSQHQEGGETQACACVPALAGVELEEDAEAVAQSSVVLGDGVVPQQHQAGQHLGAGHAAVVHQLGQALRRLRAQVRHLTKQVANEHR